jgi:hypothetical protein
VARVAFDDRVGRDAVADGELERVAVLEIGDALVGVVIDEARAGSVARRSPPSAASQDQLGLKEVPLVDAPFALGVALVHDEHGDSARARGQLVSFGAEVAHVASRHVEAHALLSGSSVRPSPLGGSETSTVCLRCVRCHALRSGCSGSSVETFV